MLQKLMEVFVNNIFGLLHGNIKLLGKRLKAYSVKQSSFKYHSVTLVENPFINKSVPLGARKVIVLNIQDILSPCPPFLQIRFHAVPLG